MTKNTLAASLISDFELSILPLFIIIIVKSNAF